MLVSCVAVLSKAGIASHWEPDLETAIHAYNDLAVIE